MTENKKEVSSELDDQCTYIYKLGIKKELTIYGVWKAPGVSLAREIISMTPARVEINEHENMVDDWYSPYMYVEEGEEKTFE